VGRKRKAPAEAGRAAAAAVADGCAGARGSASAALVVDLHDADRPARALNRGRSTRCSRSPKEVDRSIAALAAARRRGCGSMPSPTCAWAPTNACTGSCRRRATAARCSPNRSRPRVVHAVTKYLAQRLLRARARARRRPAARRAAISSTRCASERPPAPPPRPQAFLFGVLVGVGELIRRRLDLRTQVLVAEYRPFGLDDRVAVARKRAPDRFATPLAVAAFHAVEIVAGAMLAPRSRPRRADHRDARCGPSSSMSECAWSCAVDDEFRPWRASAARNSAPSRSRLR